MTGLVLRSTGSWYDVYLPDNRVIACRTRGKLRLEGYKESNPIAVGDRVEVDVVDTEGVILSIQERKNHILRQSVKKTGHASVLAANIDLAALVVTMAKPRTSSGFIDRFLVTNESFDIPTLLIFNKRDLLSSEESEDQKKLIEIYKKIGVPSLEISALNDRVDEVHGVLKNKVTLLAGHSGVGKSTLLNQLHPEAEQSVRNISDFSDKGVHTTTFAEMFKLDENTFVIDTPGIKEWGLVSMSPEELSDNFPEMRALRSECKFGYSCLHHNEPRCAVKEFVEKGEIAESRYKNYLRMLLGEDNRK